MKIDIKAKQKKGVWQAKVIRDPDSDEERWIASISGSSDLQIICKTYEEGCRKVDELIEIVNTFHGHPEPLALNYWRDPSIQNWISCREAGIIPKIRRYGGESWLGISEPILQRMGLDQKTFIKALDIDDITIQNLCIKSLKSIQAHQDAKSKGETHLSRRKDMFSLEVVDWLICVMMDSFYWYERDEIPIDLRMLIRYRLIPGASRIEDQLAVVKERKNAIWIASQIRAKGLKPSFRSVAKIMGIEPSTVKRWFSSFEEFDEASDMMKRLFNADGSLKPLHSIDPDA